MKNISPFIWIGGKQKIANKIVSIMPKHNTYVEVFGGSGAVLFSKNPNISKLEVFNDIDKNIYNFFNVLRNKKKTKELIRLLNFTPYSRDMHKEAYEIIKNDNNNNNDLKSAYYFFISIEMSFASINSCFGYGLKDSDHIKKFRSKTEKLKNFADRLKYVQIENLDFRDLISKYDSESTLFYLDPPYVSETRKEKSIYKYEMSNDDHKQLIDILLNIKGNAILSGYDNDIYKPLTDAGWNKYEIKVRCYSNNASAGKRDKRIECIWIKKQELSNLFAI